MSELKSCPFCGYDVGIYPFGDYSSKYIVECNTCSCSLGPFKSADIAEREWNTRAEIEEEEG